MQRAGWISIAFLTGCGEVVPPEELCVDDQLVRDVCVLPSDEPFPAVGQSLLDTSLSCVDRNGVCVVARREIHIEQGVTLRVIGRRPLLLLATETIDVEGILDLSGHAAAGQPDGVPGAGARPWMECPAAPGPGNDAVMSAQGGGGGAGGSFVGTGGRGGKGFSTPSGTPVGDMPVDGADPSVLVGGCSGDAGGSGYGGEGIGRGGPGGGALYAVAGVSIRVTGTIAASGGGGAAGFVGKESGGGGGGGGSGGQIALRAPAVTLTGSLHANGGGGGAGNGTMMMNTGRPGDDPQGPDQPAPGGTDDHGGGSGGAGFSRNQPPGAGGDATQPSSGGGGGGGGAGVIRVFGTLANPSGSISPDPRVEL